MRFRPPAPPSELIERVVRRERPATPMRSLRLGAAQGGASPAEFPGMLLPGPGDRKPSWVAGAISTVIHLSILGLAAFMASYAPEIEEEELIPVQLIREIPEATPDPAPAPRALAERRSVNFGPAAQAITPQVVNPTVVAQAAPSVAAERLQIDAVHSVAAPREITRSNVAVETVEAVTSVAGVESTRVELEDAAAPALRGPIEIDAPVGPSVGPRAIVAEGSTMGTGPAEVREAGSSVRAGVLSDRDVLGSPTGPRLASVNTRVGTGHLGGSGGTGSGLGGGVAPDDCLDRAEVQRYMALVRQRMEARWRATDSGGRRVKAVLRFSIDPGGSARGIELVSADDEGLGQAAVGALRAASPFPPMSDPVRCLADNVLRGRFTLSPDFAAN